MFTRSKERLIRKLDILHGLQPLRSQVETKYVKYPMLNLVGDEIPEKQKALLNLGPKFVPYMKKIPFMVIVTTAEARIWEKSL